jgi:hypothetical protein
MKGLIIVLGFLFPSILYGIQGSKNKMYKNRQSPRNVK